jgi:hypothetical protein
MHLTHVYYNVFLCPPLPFKSLFAFCCMMVSEPKLFSIEWQLTGESQIGKDGSIHRLITVLLPGLTEENHEKPESGYLVSGRDSYRA